MMFLWGSTTVKQYRVGVSAVVDEEEPLQPEGLIDKGR